MSPNRRSFLTKSGIAATQCGIASLAMSSLGSATSRLFAIDRIQRAENPQLKLSLAAYSLRDSLQKRPGTSGAMDLHGFITYCASLGIHGAELTQYYFPKATTPEYLLGLRRHAHLAGIDITGGAIGNKFTLDPGPKLDEQIEYTETWIKHYAQLGAPVIRVFAGRPPAGVSEDAALERAIPLLQNACDVAAKHGVLLAIENHDFTTKVDRLLRIVKAVDSPWFGVNFDSGNLHHSTDPYADMARIAPFAVNAQIKVVIRTANGEQPADLERIVDILRNVEYSGYLVLEYEEKEDPFKAIPNYVGQLKTLIS